MSRKLFEKPLALMQNIRFRSGSLESQFASADRQESPPVSAHDYEDGKENDSSRAAENGSQSKGSDSAVWYIDTVEEPTANNVLSTAAEPVAITTSEPLSSLSVHSGGKLLSPEKRNSRIQPKGTISYEVAGRDSLESIAAHHDTTPSELMKLNRLVTRMIFPGQVLYIPDPDYVSSSDHEPSSPELSTSPPPLSPPAENRVKVDVPLVRMADKPPAKVPGHVERQISSSSLSSKTKVDHQLPSKLSEDEARNLDQECYERFIKINVKHITDGQGVVSGTLIVTPNAVMFDPNVSDPLVIEQGAESYGMITPMDMVISAAMYHDIAAMRLRGKKPEERASSPRPEVYHDTSCPLFHSRPAEDVKVPDELDGTLADLDLSKPSHSSTVESLKSETTSVCSCGAQTLESPNADEAEKSDHEEGSLSTVDSKAELDLVSSKTGADKAEDTDTMGAVKSKEDVTNEEKEKAVSYIQGRIVGLDENDNSRLSSLNPSQQNVSEISSVGTDLTEDEGFADDANLGELSQKNASKIDESASTTDVSDSCQTSFSQDEPKLSVTLSGEEPQSVIMNTAASEDSSTVLGAKSESSSVVDGVEISGTRIGNIVYFPSDEGHIGKGIDMSGSELKPNVNVSSARDTPAQSSYLESQLSDQTDGGFRPFQTSAKHLSNFVNYATGLFRKEFDDRINVDDISEVIVTKSDRTPVMSLRSEGHLDHSLEVESAITLADKPELFQTFDKLIARPAVRMEDPPLYLCLRVGHPKNKEVSQTCPIESFRATKKKPEYWFSIPRDKVDQLYAFFVQWTPDIYGDEDEIDPETRGFVVIEDEEELDAEEHLEIVDEHFASIQKIRKDWEIISKQEAIRRMSTIDIEESVQLPDMVGETKLLSEEQLIELAQNMPARTIGYTWTLIYSTDVHGFSLKTMYRDMCHVDSPILLVVSDTSNNVFGAVTNCAFKLSDHFYGTGECFLFTFYPEFKVFHWTGDNNFFIKGNKESLSIGSGQGQFGLWLDGDLYHGRTNRCETFDNDVLTDKEDFVLKGLEAWAFV